MIRALRRLWARLVEVPEYAPQEEVDQVLKFYGYDGIYDHFFDNQGQGPNGVGPIEVTYAIRMLDAETFPDAMRIWRSTTTFDSMDRELVRDVMFYYRGFPVADLEYAAILTPSEGRA